MVPWIGNAETLQRKQCAGSLSGGGGGVRGDSLSYITLGDLLFSIRLCVPARCYALCPLDQNRSASASADSESVICWMVEEQEPLAV